MTSTMPNRVYLRIAGGGVTMPSGKPYTTVVGDDRAQNRHVEYVRADLAAYAAGFEECRRLAASIAKQFGDPYAINTNTGAMMFRAQTEKIAQAISTIEVPTLERER
jgi:hypothetical protein